MLSRLPIPWAGAVLLIALAVVTTAALAIWPHSPSVNLPLCTTVNSQFEPQIISDGADGAIVTWRDRRSGIWVEGAGTVARVLRDDADGARHQQWILRLASGHTLKFAHNVDLAPRIAELREGDAIRFRGRYEYNDKGGVIHWTHHDPQDRLIGGWIEHHGRFYK